nr:SufD family Fe-S cluster assembly protein [Longispora sp. (in: high G+C Gram-positive bacteria)]
MTNTVSPPKTRAQALRSFDVADFPVLTGREEEWRFTPLERLRGLADGSAAEKPGTAPTWRFEGLPVGVTAGHSASRDPRTGSVLVPFDRVSALAFTEHSNAFIIEVAADTVVEQPAVLSLIGGGAEGAAFGHTVIDVGALSESVLVVHQTGSVLFADNVEVLVGNSAQLTLVTIADWDSDSVQAQHVKFRLGRDAHVTHVQVTLGGDLVRQYTTAEYTGRGGDFEAFGLYFASGDMPNGSGQHQEHRLLVDHNVPDCRSHVTYRGALQGDGAHTVWVGYVLI